MKYALAFGVFSAVGALLSAAAGARSSTGIWGFSSDAPHRAGLHSARPHGAGRGLVAVLAFALLRFSAAAADAKRKPARQRRRDRAAVGGAAGSGHKLKAQERAPPRAARPRRAV